MSKQIGTKSLGVGIRPIQKAAHEHAHESSDGDLLLQSVGSDAISGSDDVFLGMSQNDMSALADRSSTSHSDAAALQSAAGALQTSQQRSATVLNSDECLLNDTMSGFRQAWTGTITVSEGDKLQANLLAKRKRKATLDFSSQLFRPNEDSVLAEIPEDASITGGTDSCDTLGLAFSTKTLRAGSVATIQRHAVRK